MPSFLHQPSYEDFPVRLSQGLWLHSSRWEPTDFQYFARERQSSARSILNLPKLYRHKRKPTPSLDAYWVYRSEETGPPLGWAELQSYPGKHFGKGFLFFVMKDIPLERAQEALMGLTSLVFTLSRNDHLHVVSLGGRRDVVDAISHFTGSVEELTSLPTHAWHPDAGELQSNICLAVDRSSWRSCTALQESQRTMKHIELRLERLDRMDKGRPKKQKKRPFLVRLFKPRVDDSLF